METNQRTKKWNGGVAAILSLLIPGLGQLYKGQAISAIVWFVAIIAGYACLIIPGLILHIMCIIGATMGNPYE